MKSGHTMGAGGEDLEGLSTLCLEPGTGIYLEGFGRVCMRHVLSQLLFQAPDILIQQFVSEMNDSKDVFYSDIYCLTV